MLAKRRSSFLEPNYVLQLYLFLYLFLLLNVILFEIFYDLRLIEPVVRFFHEINPITKYYNAMIRNGVKIFEAQYFDAFFLIGILICFLYLFVRTLVELRWRETLPNPNHLRIKILVFLLFCLPFFLFINIDDSVGIVTLTVRHSDFQNLSEILFMCGGLAVGAGEIIAQTIATRSSAFQNANSDQSGDDTHDKSRS